MIPLLAVLALGTQAHAAEPEIAYEKYELDNGLDVILAPDTSTPIVYVSVWYHVGSKDEVTGLTGFAHLYEHLMFQGSVSVPDDYFKPLQEVGASINGTTSTERTNYFEKVPARYLPLALFMESDRMGGLLPVLDQKRLDNQREVVRNERRQRYENPPYGQAYGDLMSSLYAEGHPYHHLTIGSHADLEAASIDDVKAFFSTWYAPNNASIVVSGDFDRQTAKDLIQQNFGPIPRGADPVRPTVVQTPLTEDKVVRQYQAVPERKVWMAWQSPSFYAPGDADLDLLSTLLTDGKESRLYSRLVRDKKVAKSINAGQSSGVHGSRYIISATAAEGHTTDEVVAEIKAVLAEVAADKPPTADEVEAGKIHYERMFFDNLTTIQGKGELLQMYNMYQGDPGYMAQDLKRYRAVNADSVKKWSADVLSKPHVELHIWPEADDPTPGTAPGTTTVIIEGDR